jgi:Superfamily I DNA and RNA helicases
MTLHASKGLEFPVVFIAACEEGVLPWADAACEERRQEELRLLYVGLTRAKEQVVLSWAKRRLIRGKRLERRPSPFLARLGDGLIERASPSAPPRRPTSRQRSLFGDP